MQYAIKTKVVRHHLLIKNHRFATWFSQKIPKELQDFGKFSKSKMEILQKLKAETQSNKTFTVNKKDYG